MNLDRISHALMALNDELTRRGEHARVHSFTPSDGIARPWAGGSLFVYTEVMWEITPDAPLADLDHYEELVCRALRPVFLPDVAFSVGIEFRSSVEIQAGASLEIRLPKGHRRD